MDRTLIEQLMQAMHSFKRVTMTFPPELDLRMGEMMLMKMIASKVMPSGKSANVSDLHDEHHMTKSAVSQILNTLESKGYVKREIDRSDRRKIAVMLTDHGWKTLKQARICMDQELDKVITRLGEDDTHKLIELLIRLKEIAVDVRREAQLTEGKGDNQLD